MAAKYMGAKMLQKQIEKEKAKKELVRKKGTTHANKGEFLDRKKQKFEMTQSSMNIDGDFIDHEKGEVDNHPEYNKAYEMLRKREEFFLTMNENLLHKNDDSDSDDETAQFTEFIHRANNETQTLFRGLASSQGGRDSQASFVFEDSMNEDYSARALLPEKAVGVEVVGGEQSDFDKDVTKLKQRIASTLAAYQDMIQPRRFIIKASSSNFLNQFEYLVMILAIWNAIWTPLTIAFDRADEIASGMTFTVIDYCVDVVFLIDIILGFMSSYVDVANGDEIFAPKKIARHYMFKGSFFVDFMSTFPFRLIGEQAGIPKQSGYTLFANIMKLLKALRLKKILKKIRDMPITIEDKALMQVMYYAFLIFVYTHIIGCIMWLSLKTDERWVPAVDFGSVDVKTHLDYRFDGDGNKIMLTENYVLMYEWFTSWYNSAISFALVEVNARTQNQITMMFMIYVVNAMINAYLIGVFIEQFSVKNAKKQEKQDELDESNTTMINLKIIPDPLKHQIRTYFLQSFQMRMLQQEFVEISDNLKASLQQRMKFEIAERIISDSRNFMYLRLYMIKVYQDRVEMLQEKNPESPLLLKLTPLSVAQEYKNLMFEVINNLKMAHHRPGERVITQNEPVLDDEHEFLDDAHVYFIMTGNYKVLSLMFEMKKKRDSSHGKAGDDNAQSSKLQKRGLRSGDFFGEVSLIFGTRRTATVKAKQYCECAYLENKQFFQILANFPVMKNYLIKNIMASYDDELRIFLVSCLQKIPYMKGISEEALTHIAMHMIAQQADKESFLYEESGSFSKVQIEDLIIVYEGKLQVFVQVDRGTELVVEYLGKGSIFNANNFLAGRASHSSVRCLTSVTYYYLPFDSIHEISQVYPQLQQALDVAQKQARYNKMLDLQPIDYIETNFNLDEKYTMPQLAKLTEQEKQRIPELRLMMKNAVFHSLGQVRKQSKYTSLTSILEAAVVKHKKKVTEREQLKKEIQQMGLVQRLDTLNISKARITDERFEKLKTFGSILGKENLITIMKTMNELKDVVDKRLIPVLEDGEYDSDLEFEDQRGGQKAHD